MPRNKVGHLGPQEVLEAQIKLLARKDDTLEKANNMYVAECVKLGSFSSFHFFQVN